MLITMVLSLLNSELYKYVPQTPPAFAITYITTPCTENQAAKLALERLPLNEIGKEQGASISGPDGLRHQGLGMPHVTSRVLSL